MYIEEECCNCEDYDMENNRCSLANYDLLDDCPRKINYSEDDEDDNDINDMAAWFVMMENEGAF